MNPSTPRTPSNSPAPQTNPQPGRCPRCHAANLLTVSACFMCGAPLTPTVRASSPRRAQPLIWGLMLSALVLGVGALVYQSDLGKSAVKTPSQPTIPASPTVTSSHTAPPATVAAPPKVANPESASPRIVLVPSQLPPLPQMIGGNRQPGTGQRVDRRRPTSRRDTGNTLASDQRPFPIPKSERPAGVMGAFLSDDVSIVANQIRAASTQDEFDALEAFIDNMRATYSRLGGGAALFALNGLRNAVREKRRGPNGAGLNFWRTTLANAEKEAREISRQSRMTPAEQQREGEAVAQRILAFQRSAHRNGPPRRP